MRSRIQIYLPLIISLSLIAGILAGIYFGKNITFKHKLIVHREKRTDRIQEIINYVNQAYVDSTSYSELEQKAINGMLQSLDPHSEYVPASEFNDMNDQLQGRFEGIGVQFRLERDTIVVINTISGGPSEKIGIRAGDRIIMIEGKKFVGKKITNDIVMKNLKGPKGTKVKVGILRRGVASLIDFTIVRDVIPTTSIDAAYMINRETGYIKLSKFSATTVREFRDALNTLAEKGMKKLILDLRSNGGGYLESAIKVADELLPDGKLIVYTEGKHSPRREMFATGEGIFETQPLAVLIDDWSASSSEIVAGAIQDNDRSIIIGRRSFGKGLVQEQLKLKDGSAIRLTVARYYTPTGRCIQKPYENGVEDYYEKFYSRFTDGEVQNPDSIHFLKTQQFRTKKGKIVYGGGGIMPDIYIPYKKEEFPEFYLKAYNKGLIYQFAFDYADRNRSGLNKIKSSRTFIRDFTPDAEMLREFREYAGKNGISSADDSFAKSMKLLKIHLKAGIARNIFDEETYYEIANSADNMVEKAVQKLEAQK